MKQTYTHSMGGQEGREDRESRISLTQGTVEGNELEAQRVKVQTQSCGQGRQGFKYGNRTGIPLGFEFGCDFRQ